MQPSETLYPGMENILLSFFFCAGIVLAIDKTTIEYLLLELINNKLLIEMLIKNNLQQNFTLYLRSFLSCVP